MNYIIEGLLELNKVNEYDIIETIDVCDVIDLNVYYNENKNDYFFLNDFNCNFKNINENYYENNLDYENVNNNVNINENNIVNNKTNSDSSFEKYLNTGNFKKTNENSLDCNNKNKSIEILSLYVTINDKSINKISNKNTYIYIINFVYSINIKLCINSKFIEINFKEMHSKSFKYKDVKISDLDLYPINLDFKNLKNKISFGLNCIIVDKSEDVILQNYVEPNEQIRENINKKDYSYIDINQEFI